MKTPAKILLAKEYLSDAEAVSLLEHLCDLDAITYEDFKQLIVEKEIAFYFHGLSLFKLPILAEVNPPILPFKTSDGSTIQVSTDQEFKVTSGHLMVRTFDAGAQSEHSTLEVDIDAALFKPMKLEGKNEQGVTGYSCIGREEASVLTVRIPALFKPADIEDLAVKINGKSPAQEELEQLRQRVAELESESPANSALLVIARALELYLDGPANRNQASFVADLQQGHETVHGLSDRTINGLLAKANKALENARKS